MDWAGPAAEALARGMRTTLLLCAATLSLSLIFGILIGMGGVVLPRPARLVLRAYVELWRGLPGVVTLFIVFFGLPQAGIFIGVFEAGVVGLTLWGSANIAEIARAALLSIPASQYRAARALGFSSRRTLWFVIFPQAFRRMLPPLVSLLVHLIQNSTLIAIVGDIEVMAAAKQTVGRLLFQEGNAHSYWIFGAVGAFFFCICFPLARLAVWLEKRMVV